jgi:hypothetical protein
MTNEQLLSLIQSDKQAMKLARSGADDMCAARVREIAPKELTNQSWSYRSLSAVLDLQTMARLIATVDAFIAAGDPLSPLVNEIRNYLRADGIDLSNANTRYMLGAWADNEQLPLSTSDLAAIIEAVSVAPQINSIDITNLGLYEPA